MISVPQKAPEGAITRNETSIDLLERVKKVSNEWVRTGHQKGQNTHNVSATISIKEGEWDTVGEWMWENRGVYNGLSVLPHDGGNYIQSPFEDCTREEYEKLASTLTAVNLSQVIEIEDNTDLKGEVACHAGQCEVF